jgi:hypothetical protein
VAPEACPRRSRARVAAHGIRARPAARLLAQPGGLRRRERRLIHDQLVDQQIVVLKAEADYTIARENLSMVENQCKSDTDKAKLLAQFAELDLNKYREGEYPNAEKEAQARITLDRKTSVGPRKRPNGRRSFLTRNISPSRRRTMMTWRRKRPRWI